MKHAIIVGHPDPSSFTLAMHVDALAYCADQWPTDVVNGATFGTWYDRAMDAAQCIGCGACVAACKNASAMLFVSAKVGHLGLLHLAHTVRQYLREQTYPKHDQESWPSTC